MIFDVGDQVKVSVKSPNKENEIESLGEIICISRNEDGTKLYGVKCLDGKFGAHDCEDVKLIKGSPDKTQSHNSLWFLEKDMILSKENMQNIFTGKAVSAKDSNNLFTKGKIYTFVNGTVITDRGSILGESVPFSKSAFEKGGFFNNSIFYLIPILEDCL